MSSLIPHRRKHPEDTSLSTFRQQMDELMNDFFGSSWFTPHSTPATDVSETDKEVEVRADVPGFKADDIDIEVGDSTLFIRGEHKEEQEEGAPDKKFHRVERRQASFSRTIALPCQVDEEQITAQLADGILRVTLAKAKEAQRKKIEIKG